jgi:hypothetical protein
MLIDVPFLHTSAIVKTRGKSIGQYAFANRIYSLGVTSVDIAEPEPVDAPVALRVEVLRRIVNRQPVSETVPIRFHEGRFFEPLARSLTNVSAFSVEMLRRPQNPRLREKLPGHPFVAALAAEIGADKGFHVMAGVGDWLSGKEMFVPQPKAATDGAYQEGIEAAHRAASSMIIVEGEVYHRVPEPVIQVSSNTTEETADLSVRLVAEVYGEARIPHRSRFATPQANPVFPVDALDQAYAYMDENISRRMTTWSSVVGIEVAMPEAFGFDRSRFVISKTAEYLLSQVEESVARQDDEVIVAFMDLRAMYRRGLQSWDDTVADSIVNLTRALSPHFVMSHSIIEACLSALDEMPITVPSLT